MLTRCFSPSVSQAGGVVQRTPASHVPLVHIGAVLQQELASYEGSLTDTDRQTEGKHKPGYFQVQQVKQVFKQFYYSIIIIIIIGLSIS